MGKTKSKAVPIAENNETWIMNERQTNVNKLIERMTSRAECNEPKKPETKAKPDSDLKRILSFRRKTRKKKFEVSENNNDIDLVLNERPLRNCELDCCEMTDKSTTNIDDVDHVNVAINKQDSIDNIIDLIVDKSVKRDETLNRSVDESDAKKSKKHLRRARSYHGEEIKKKKSYTKVRSMDETDNKDENLMTRLENLEKRTLIFEKGVDKIGAWLKGSEEKEKERAKESNLDDTKENAGSNLGFDEKYNRTTDLRSEEENSQGMDLAPGLGQKDTLEVSGNIFKHSEQVSESEQKEKNRITDFEYNMRNVLKENYREEAPETDLKTIERVRPFERDSNKNEMIVSPKADPIIRNTIEKLTTKKEEEVADKEYEEFQDPEGKSEKETPSCKGKSVWRVF